MDKKFPPEKLARLNDPKRLAYLPPDLIWQTLSPGAEGIRTAIEIGAGTGFFASRFARKLAGGKVYACDILDVMVEWMRENLPADLSDAVIPLRMEESSVPLPDGMADLVYMIELHHELEEPEKVIGEARRLLRAGGRLLIIDWKKEETPAGPPLPIRVDAAQIVSQVKKGGFSGVRNLKVLQYHNFILGEK